MHKIIQSDINEFIDSFSFDEDDISYDGKTLILRSSSNLEFINLNKIIKLIFSEVHELPGDKTEIILSSCTVDMASFFYREDDFIAKYERFSMNFEKSLLIILKPKNKTIFKDFDNLNIKKNRFIFNFHEYRKVLHYFLTKPEFTPYKSDTDKIFTLISKTHGVFNVGFKTPSKDFFQNVDFAGILERIKNEFEKKEFIQFFKEVVITGVHSTSEKDRFAEIIKSIDTLISLSERDYDTYVSSFAFDKIKSEFKTERESYFDNLDKNIASVGKQVVSFPLTFAATIFASYKVKDQPGVILLILLAYLLYTVVAFLILKMTAYNVKCLREDVESEENNIKNSYKIIYIDFKEDFIKINNKILNLRIIIGMLYLVLVFLFLLFAAYAMHNMHWIDLSLFAEWIPSITVEGKTK